MVSAIRSASRLCERIVEIATLPTTAAKIIETVSSPESGARELMRAVQADPALAARVLRTVNSAAFGLSARVDNLQTAIAYLGFNQIRNLAFAASICEPFRGGPEVGPYTRVGLWRHLVATAVVARMVARRVDIQDAESVFLAGLLHDIGIILLDQNASADYCAILQSLPQSAGETKAQKAKTPSLSSLERRRLGFDHCQLGAAVARQWRFPEGLVSAIEAARQAVAFGFGEAGLDELVSFTSCGNLRSRRLMERLGFVHDPAGDFAHPNIPAGHELRPHVLYRKRAPRR